MKKLVLISLAALSIYGCKKVDSNDLKDEVPYYQEYNVMYDKTNNKTNVSAICRVRDSKGTKVEFSNGAGITANGTTPSIDLFDKAIYRWSFNNTSDINFVMTKNSGVKVNNATGLGDMGRSDFPATLPTSVSKTGFSFNWDGDGLSDGESVTITLTADSGTVTKEVLKANAPTVSFTSTELNKLKAGSLNMKMERRRTLPLDNKDGNAEGYIDLKANVSKTITLTN